MSNKYSKGETLVFRGYSDKTIPEDEHIFTAGQRVHVYEVDENNGYAVLPFNEDGSVNETIGDTAYLDELCTVEEWDAQYSPEAQSAAAQAAEADTATAEAAPKAKRTAKKTTDADGEPVKTKAEQKAEAKAAKAAAAAAEKQAKITPVTTVEVTHTTSVAAILEEQDALEAANVLVERQAENDFTLGGVLSEIRTKGIYQRLGYDGTKGFRDYVEKTLDIHYRKAMYLISIYDHFVALGIGEERLAEIGWSKAKELVSLPTAQEVNDAIDFAKDHTRDELIERIRVGQVDAEAAGSANATATKTTLTFRLFSAQADTVTRALASAKVEAGSDSDDAALEHICGEWLLLQENNPVSLEQAVALLNARYGSTFVVGESEQAGVSEVEADANEEQQEQQA